MHALRLILALVFLMAVGLASPVEAAPAPSTTAADFLAPVFFPLAPSVGRPLRRLEVDLARQQLVAYEGLAPVRALVVSTGDWEHPTIIGRYRIQQKYERIDLVGTDYYYHDVPYVLLITRPFYIHAAPWRAEFGVPASRGCVTLSTVDAAWLYQWTEIGTLVIIHW